MALLPLSEPDASIPKPGAPDLLNDTDPMAIASATDRPAVPDLSISAAFTRAHEPRRVLVYAPLAFSTPHFETDLEIAQRHLDLGDNVELVLCDAELSSCQLNPNGELRRCVQCVSRNLQGTAQLSVKVPVLGLTASLTPEDHARLTGLPREFPSQQALRKFCFDGFDAGMATLSSIIDFTRALTVDTKLLAPSIHRTLHAAVATFLGFKRILATSHYDRVYIYNGRWSMMRSAVRACEQLGVPYYTHERGSDFQKFAVYRDTLPHQKDNFRQRTKAAWENAVGHPQTTTLAEVFFHGRRQRVEKAWFSHVKLQETGRLPLGWECDGRRIVFFTSSEFEFAAIGGDATGKIYPTQVDGLRRLAGLLAEQSPETRLWVRVHPNDKNPAAIKRWTEAAASLRNVTLIAPDETIDSYSLLEGADRVLTFGSTIGIEATYWGRPSICADFSFFDGLDAHYEPATEGELIDLLVRRDLAPKPQENALRYGYYLNTFGANFAHFATGTISDYEFKSPFRGRCLKPDYDDMRQRLAGLFQQGEIRRAAAIATLCAAFDPADGLAHSIRILSQLRLRETDTAIAALEEAAAKSAPPQLEAILKSTGKELLDAIQRIQREQTAETFQTLARRAATVLQRAPAFAALGRNLAALVARDPAAAA